MIDRGAGDGCLAVFLVNTTLPSRLDSSGRERPYVPLAVG